MVHVRSEEFNDRSRWNVGRKGLMSLLARWDSFGGAIPGHEIRLGLESLTLDRDALLDWVHFSEQAYQRNLIHCTDAYEILVLCWRSGQRSPIHDHGESTCGVLVVEGVATETVFAASSGTRLIKAQARRIEAGSVIVSRGDDIHQIANLEFPGTDLVSLHAYSPRLQVYRAYDIDDVEIRTAPQIHTNSPEVSAASRDTQSVASPDVDGPQEVETDMNWRTDPAAGLATVAIIGGGFSGTMVAVHLSRLGSRSPRVLLFERGNRLARGAAYGTTRPEHLLNVPARLMSAFTDEPDHFLNWLRERDSAVQPGAFVARQVYGDYLEELLRGAMNRPDSRLTTIQAEVVDVIDEPSGRTTVVTSEGERFAADAVVVAVGNPGPQDPVSVPASMRANGKYISNPWVEDPFRGLKEDDPIVVIGSGLTMVDLVVEAESRKLAGKITAVSRHGLTPQPHKPAPTMAPPNLGSVSPPTVRNLLRALRTAAQDIEESGGDWRSMMDSLRGSVQDLWRSLGESEKERFLRHLAVYWDVHRHRVAPEIHQVLSTATSEGRFNVIAGRINSLIEDEHEVQVVFRRRGSKACEPLSAQRVINCTGPSRDLHAGFPSLIGALCNRGLGRPDPIGLGLQAGENAALVGSRGTCSERIFAIGSVLKGELWETTAVRELRVQAADLASHLASVLERSSRSTVPAPGRSHTGGLARPVGTNPARPPRHRSAT